MKALISAGTALMVAGLIGMGCNGSSQGKETAVGMKTCPAEKGASAGATCPVQGAGTNRAAGAVCPVQGHEKGAMGNQETIEGAVIQTLSAGRYLYVEVETKSGPVWLAAVATAEPVAKGDKISCRQGLLMEKFSSPMLKRTFDKVYFVESLIAPENSSATNNPVQK